MVLILEIKGQTIRYKIQSGAPRQTTRFYSNSNPALTLTVTKCWQLQIQSAGRPSNKNHPRHQLKPSTRRFILHNIVKFIQIANESFAYISIRFWKRRVRELDAWWGSSFAALDDFLLQRDFAEDRDIHFFRELVNSVVVQDIRVLAVLANHIRHVLNDSNDGHLQCFVHVGASFGDIQGSCLGCANENNAR